jgi:hypothetical protein
MEVIHVGIVGRVTCCSAASVLGGTTASSNHFCNLFSLDEQSVLGFSFEKTTSVVGAMGCSKLKANKLALVL